MLTSRLTIHRVAGTIVLSGAVVALAATATPASAAARRGRGEPLPAGRPAISKDPGALMADGRSKAGVIVATSPALDDVPVTSVAYDGASVRREEYALNLSDANHRLETSGARLAEIDTEQAALKALVDRRRRQVHKLARRYRELQATLRSVAINRFISGSGENLYPDPNRTVEEALEKSHEQMLSRQGEQHLESNAAFVHERIRRTTADADDMDRQRRDNEKERTAAQADHDRARADANVATAAVAGAEAELRSARPMTVVTGSDLPFVALDAYWRAANALAQTQPACRLNWWGLAGIGRSESDHGREAGGQPGPDGRVTVPIFGIPLDGTNGTQAVRDTDHGAMDLDPVWDRAVGVMQFIPGTWKRYAEDESGDGLADPQNIYDAALASARLLCTHGPGLDTDAALRRAYYSYNHSDAYVERVLGRAHDYEQLPVPQSSYLPAPPPIDTTTTTTTTTTTLK